MHLLTHALAGWCVGNCFADSSRERALCLGLSLMPDLDGAAILGGVQVFYDYHHVVAHNALVAVSFSGVVALFSKRWIGAFFLSLTVVHLHLLMDLFGSGPGWGISYFWPFDQVEFSLPWGWAIDAWQNYAVLAVTMFWAAVIAFRWRRTPLELLAPRFDAAILAFVGGGLPRRLRVK